MSGGQQQRVGIARSLAVAPEIWFLDEPFSALDPLIRREMQVELMRLQGVLKKTIIFITHDFDEAIRLADRIAIMKDGEIIQIGTPEELVTHPGDRLCRRVHPRRESRQGAVRTKHDAGESAASDAWRHGQAAAKVASFAPEIVASELPFAVVDVSGQDGRRDRAKGGDRSSGRPRPGGCASVTEAVLSDRRHDLAGSTARRPRDRHACGRRWRLSSSPI